MKTFFKSKTAEPEIKAIDEPSVEPEVAPEAPAEEEAPSELETLKSEMLDAINSVKVEIFDAIKALTAEPSEPSEPEENLEEVEAAKAKAIAEAAINILGEAGYTPLELKETSATSNTVSRESFNAMSPRQKSEFSKNGGRISN